MNRDERDTLIVRANGELDHAFAQAHKATGQLHPWSDTYNVDAAVTSLKEALRAATSARDIFTELEKE